MGTKPKPKKEKPRPDVTPEPPPPPKAGRPPGSTTQRLPQTIRILPPCPKCGDRSEPKTLRTLPVQHYSGEMNGVPFSEIHRRRVLCGNPGCGQVRIERTYE